MKWIVTSHGIINPAHIVYVSVSDKKVTVHLTPSTPAPQEVHLSGDDMKKFLDALGAGVTSRGRD